MRVVGGVIVGYFVMAILVVFMLFGMYAAMGSERAFQAGRYESSMLWNVLSLALGLVAATVGGWVCRRIGGDKAATWLAGLILVLGLLLSLSAFGPHPNDVRPEGLTGSAAMQKAYTPVWVALLNPILGAFGVLWLSAKLTGPADQST